jgi:hypothetical protein
MLYVANPPGVPRIGWATGGMGMGSRYGVSTAEQVTSEQSVKCPW